MHRLFPLVLTTLALTVAPSWASPPASGFRLEILVDGRAVPQYPARGTVYVEAVKGSDYAIRLHNPLDVRVAVALSVDGLNTIDARWTSAATARKWVLDPHETIVIPGWQTDMNHARRFFFTSERESYAEWLGKTENMGVISAVFFRERIARIEATMAAPIEGKSQGEARGSAAGGAAGAPTRESSRADSTVRPSPPAPNVAGRQPEEYAATGIGDRADHAVRRISMDLEKEPVATLDVRYEFRPQLVRLGVLPPVPGASDPLARREGARGFEPGFCPEPPARKK